MCVLKRVTCWPPRDRRTDGKTEGHRDRDAAGDADAAAGGGQRGDGRSLPGGHEQRRPLGSDQPRPLKRRRRPATAAAAAAESTLAMDGENLAALSGGLERDRERLPPIYSNSSPAVRASAPSVLLLKPCRPENISGAYFIFIFFKVIK